MSEPVDALSKSIEEWETALPEDASLTETLLVLEVQHAVRASLDRAQAIMAHVERMEACGLLTDSDIARLVLAQTEVTRLVQALSYLLRGHDGGSDLDQLIEVSNLLN